VDKSKIKNFIIILLALVNVFLLVIVISSAREARKADTYRKKALETVLSENGITLNPSIVLPNYTPAQLSLARNMSTEKRNISELIGNCTVEDQGGNSYFYLGTDGQAKFRGTGEFEISMNAGVISTGKSPIATATATLKKLNIECSDIQPVVTEEGSTTTVTLCGAWDGTAIYNERISFVFTSNYLWLINGTRPLDTKYSVLSSENYPDSVTILMNFLEFVNATGYVCSEINDVNIQYKMNSAISQNCTLKPVWCIVTNSGSHYIDAQTGEAENIESSP